MGVVNIDALFYIIIADGIMASIGLGGAARGLHSMQILQACALKGGDIRCPPPLPEHDRFMGSQWTTKSKQLHAIGGFCLQLVVNQWSSAGQIVSRKIK